MENFVLGLILGDICKIKGSELEPVDIITFGSPCQNMSIAGNREGIKHITIGSNETTQSGLFIEAIRVIKEMRLATNGIYPRFAVWENVPGAFSSNKGEDFRTVLENLLESRNRTPLCLRFQKQAGLTPTVLVETDGALRTELLTLNTGESPNVAVESTLSQILEVDVPEKYYLSKKACEGILRRAERRGKKLPDVLKTALEQQSAE